MHFLDNPPQPGQTFDFTLPVFWNSKISIINIYDSDMEGCANYHKVGEAKVSFTVPDSFDGPFLVVSTLEAQKTKLMADYQAAMTEITARINSFLALENSK